MTTYDINVPIRNRQEQIEPAEQRDDLSENVAFGERVVSVAAGGVIALTGLKRRTIPGLLMAVAGAALVKRGVSGHCEMFEALGINTNRRGAAEPEDYYDRGIHVEESFTVNKPPEELYAFWRNFENLPRIMRHLESVQVLDEKRSHWRAKGPAGYDVEWDAEVINDEPNRLIAWRSLDEADVDNSGSVRFIEAPQGRGTEVKVTVEYIPPAGRLGSVVAKLFGRDADQEIRADLRCFKQIMEAGEVPTTEGQPRGTCG